MHYNTPLVATPTCTTPTCIPSVEALIIERVVEYLGAAVHHGDPHPQGHSVAVDTLMVVTSNHEALEYVTHSSLIP